MRTPHERATEELIDNHWLGLGNTRELILPNLFAERSAEDIQDPTRFLLELMRNSDYFGYTCKYLLGKQLAPFQLAILHELWYRPFPMLVGSRGLGKSFLLGVYAVLRALLFQGSKIVIVGAAFRQAKLVFEYCEDIWYNSPVLRDICGDSSKNGPRRDVDRCIFRLGESFIVALPLGNGEKIRGQRANIILCDEFASIGVEIFENVVSGFAAVSLSPIEKLREASRRAKMRELGMLAHAEAEPSIPGINTNQTVLSGTAYYSFNHFSTYWKRYKAIIESKGDQRALENIFGGEIPENFNWRDYSVIRIPVKMLPPGFMDEKHVAKARATIHLSQYQMEYGAIFPSDSNGFFKRSLIESCVVGKSDAPISMPSCGMVTFQAVLKGLANRRYVMAIDPASENDNFSIVILELWPDHRRVVHCWTTTRKRHRAKLNKGLVVEQDFYSYIARKIRDLLHLFPGCERVAIDMQGGGVAVVEALADPSRLIQGERPLYPVQDPDNPTDTDSLPGEHILVPVQFARADWVAEANHGMRKDMEDKALLFPDFDAAVLGLAIAQDEVVGRTVEEEKLYDTLEDAVLEIEELKDELATIVHTQTGTTMRDHWDTPEVKLPGSKKGRLRKDRYSALLMANMVARQLTRATPVKRYDIYGGFAHELVRRKEKQRGPAAHQNPDWYQKALSPKFGAVVRHRPTV